jgi:O-methyltransferase involved in polyketide biosynthesis
MTDEQRAPVTSRPDVPPAGADPATPHNARVWNYWLGGTDNYPADRQAGDRVAGMFPGIVEVAQANRAFLGRVVRYLAAEAGIRQFLDLGSGLPSAGATHEIAAAAGPGGAGPGGAGPGLRVLYVDNDPLVLAHGRGLLAGAGPGVAGYIDADLRDPGLVLRQAGEELDFGRPVALLMLGVLNFIPDTAQAGAIVRHLAGAVTPGSYLAITHPTLELGGEANARAMRFWNENATPPITARTGAEIAGFFRGLRLLEPGLVPCSRWRPGRPGPREPPEVPQYGAVARKD